MPVTIRPSSRMELFWQTAESNLAALPQAEARGATSSYIPDQVLPYSIQWSLGVQHQFAKDYTAEVRYLGTRGVHLLVQNQMLRFPKVTADRNLPTYFTAPTQATLDALTN